MVYTKRSCGSHLRFPPPLFFLLPLPSVLTTVFLRTLCLNRNSNLALLGPSSPIIISDYTYKDAARAYT